MMSSGPTQSVTSYMTGELDPTTLPSSAACLRNRDPILATIAPILQDAEHVLEIGSGTGEHAVYFAEKMPHLQWHTSDLACNHEVINAWIDMSQLSNVERPLELDATAGEWQVGEHCIEWVYTANVLHIVSWELCASLIGHAAGALRGGKEGVGGRKKKGLLVYGPFNYGGKYTSESNARFDEWLKNRDPQSAIRDIEAVKQVAEEKGFLLVNDFEMPANNRLLQFELAY